MKEQNKQFKRFPRKKIKHQSLQVDLKEILMFQKVVNKAEIGDGPISILVYKTIFPYSNIIHQRKRIGKSIGIKFKKSSFFNISYRGKCKIIMRIKIIKMEMFLLSVLVFLQYCVSINALISLTKYLVRAFFKEVLVYQNCSSNSFNSTLTY